MLLSHRELARRAESLARLQSPCTLCPRRCLADRAAGDTGYCGATAVPEVSSYGPHFGEERELVGTGGSGTIFFTRCNLGCAFCQNYDISKLGRGRRVSVRDVANMMLDLERRGCANINLVTPTHYVPQIVEALAIAREEGLELPVVYNCGGYESVEALKILEGVVDIYMPDAKFGDPEAGARFCAVPDYPDRMMESLEEMQRQVGDLVLDGHGIAVRGLLVRHLVMPAGLAGTERLLEMLASRISPSAAVNVMSQYRPCGEVVGAPDAAGRCVTREEHAAAVAKARSLGLRVID